MILDYAGITFFGQLHYKASIYWPPCQLI